MGYDTQFAGYIKLDRPLSQEHKDYLISFWGSRRMKRDAKIAETLPDPVRKAVGLPIGTEGEFYVGGAPHDYGQAGDESVVDYTVPPSTQPSLWCRWIVDEDDDSILRLDGGEKIYEYDKWLVYIIDNFLKPWGYVANGCIKWQGEDIDDRGKIYCKNNEITITYLE